MPDFNVRSDSVNVEQIMDQIRARIREKRGVDYTEQQIRELAAVKLEKFLDPRGVRSDLLEQFRKAQPAYTPPELPNYAFEDQTLYESTRPPLRWIRKLLNSILKLFFNPNPLIQALNIQSRLNTMYGEREARREATRRAFDQLQYELMHNMVIETTRMSIEVKNLKMRVESLASRLEFNERRARALESVVAYKPSGEDQGEPLAATPNMAREPRAAPRFEPGPAPHQEYQERAEPGRGMNPSSAALGRGPQGRLEQGRGTPGTGQGPSAQGRSALQAPGASSQSRDEQGQISTGSGHGQPTEGPGQRSRRRRRRRGRRGGGSATAIMGGMPPVPQAPANHLGASEPSSASPEPRAHPAPEGAAAHSEQSPAALAPAFDSPSTGADSDERPARADQQADRGTTGIGDDASTSTGQDDPQ